MGNTPCTQPQIVPPAVHPHARGEHGEGKGGRRHGDGSSPRPWGTLCACIHVQPGRRFIPTPVGNTSRKSDAHPRRTVHPHARGEHASGMSCSRSSDGSSPRPWGTRSRADRADHRGRFIPTPVGNTCLTTCTTTASAVHPHARGEHSDGGVCSLSDVGSSPRPWGTQVRNPSFSDMNRFIPTPVGNTEVSSTRWRCGSVHPHARGEHARRRTSSGCIGGSSPRPWGTPGRAGHLRHLGRFIPTPVGNTHSAASASALPTVHPHARGEHAETDKTITEMGGSSPRPWGTRASAGAMPPCTAVHPHARGEHHSRPISAWATAG